MREAVMVEYVTQSEGDTIALAASMAAALRSGDVLALNGPLGSGKTRFVRGLVRGLGLDERSVSSPTFLICHEYRPATTAGEQRLGIIHIDAYRLRGVEELDTIGWDEFLQRDDVVIAVEWADCVDSELPDNRISIEFEHIGETQRRITIHDRSNDDDRFNGLEAVLQRDTKPCPICSTPVHEDAETLPFCSARCRMVDLGNWFSGSRVISRPLREDDFDQR